MAETERQGKQYAKLGHRKRSHARKKLFYCSTQLIIRSVTQMLYDYDALLTVN
jgi:hypothetical protein